MIIACHRQGGYDRHLMSSIPQRHSLPPPATKHALSFSKRFQTETIIDTCGISPQKPLGRFDSSILELLFILAIDVQDDMVKKLRPVTS
jgi:hypothetical protein